MKKFFAKLKELKNNTVYAVKEIKNQPLNSLGVILPVSAALLAVIGFIIAFVVFIVNGDYASQIHAIKDSGISAIASEFTLGTVGILNRGIIGFIIKVLLIAAAVNAMITFVKRTVKFKKFFMVVDFIVIAILGISYLIYLIFGDSLPTSVTDTTAKVIFFAVGIFAVLSLIILMFKSDDSWMLWNTLLSFAFSLIILPATLLIFENILVLLFTIIVLAVLLLLFFVFYKVIVSSVRVHKESDKDNDGKKDNDDSDGKQKDMFI